MDKDLAFASAVEVRKLIDSKSVSIVELTQLFLDRIEEFNPKLNAYLAMRPEQALADARAAQEAVDRGDTLGPLHGIPISIKDLEATKDMTTTMGSAVFRDRATEMDSIVVERVRQAGAIILGKTNAPEFGITPSTENKLGDACRNPWNTQRTPGGSSGCAAAAQAAGLCTLSTGSDGGGSIRIPCSFSGLFGIKPSQGRVPRYGGYARPYFGQSGPMTHTVEDSALLLQVLAGPDQRDVTCIREAPDDYRANLQSGVSGWRIAWSPDMGYAPVDPEVVRVTEGAAKFFQELGAQVDEPNLVIDDPWPPFWDLFTNSAYASYGHMLEERRNDFTDYGIRILEYGASVTGADAVRALLRVDQMRRQMEIFFDEDDLLLTPTMAVPAFPIGEPPSVIGGKEVDPFGDACPSPFPST